MNVSWERGKVKPSAGISTMSAIKFNILIHNELQSTVHMPSHHMHCGRIWDLTQVYLEQKLATKVVLHLFPSPREKYIYFIIIIIIIIKNSYPAWDQIQDSVTVPEWQNPLCILFLMNYFPKLNSFSSVF